MYSAVIVAAGKGQRSQLEYNKVFYDFKGRQLIDFTLQPFFEDGKCDKIYLVLSKDDFHLFVNKELNPKLEIVMGGHTRQESVFNGLSKVTTQYVLIHDGARPNINSLYIDKLLGLLPKNKAVTLALPVTDTLNYVQNGILGDTIIRENVVRIQTPQAFETESLLKAHHLAIVSKRQYTDDASLYQHELSETVYVISGDEYNIKATTKVDFMVLEDILCTK